MFTSTSALIITSIFGIVIIAHFSTSILDKTIDLFKRMRD